jgi:hypothetical protein
MIDWCLVRESNLKALDVSYPRTFKKSKDRVLLDSLVAIKSFDGKKMTLAIEFTRSKIGVVELHFYGLPAYLEACMLLESHGYADICKRYPEYDSYFLKKPTLGGYKK